MFELDSALMADTVIIGDFPLCRLLIHRDANYPWFILVPRIADVTEIYHLSEQDQYQLIRESSLLAETLVDVFSPDKVNIATLGNRVAQLHVHHLARRCLARSYLGTAAGTGLYRGVACGAGRSTCQCTRRG